MGVKAKSLDYTHFNLYESELIYSRDTLSAAHQYMEMRILKAKVITNLITHASLSFKIFILNARVDVIVPEYFYIHLSRCI